MTVPLRNHPGTGSAPAQLLGAATIFGVVFGSAKAQRTVHGFTVGYWWAAAASSGRVPSSAVP
jgi:hypothetical protein